LDTKLKGDIAEQSAVLRALKNGWGVLKPIGDRLPYDLGFDIEGTLVKIQVKSAWFHKPADCFVTDNRRTKTNRRLMLRQAYSCADFDFALVFIEEKELFYVFPVDVFVAYGSLISLVESDKRQRKPRSAEYREAWELISKWAAREEIRVRLPVKVGEASCGGNPEPSSNIIVGEGVET